MSSVSPWADRGGKVAPSGQVRARPSSEGTDPAGPGKKASRSTTSKPRPSTDGYTAKGTPGIELRERHGVAIDKTAVAQGVPLPRTFVPRTSPALEQTLDAIDSAVLSGSISLPEAPFPLPDGLNIHFDVEVRNGRVVPGARRAVLFPPLPPIALVPGGPLITGLLVSLDLKRRPSGQMVAQVRIGSGDKPIKVWSFKIPDTPGALARELGRAGSQGDEAQPTIHRLHLSELSFKDQDIQIPYEGGVLRLREQHNLSLCLEETDQGDLKLLVNGDAEDVELKTQDGEIRATKARIEVESLVDIDPGSSSPFANAVFKSTLRNLSAAQADIRVPELGTVLSFDEPKISGDLLGSASSLEETTGTLSFAGKITDTNVVLPDMDALEFHQIGDPAEVQGELKLSRKSLELRLGLKDAALALQQKVPDQNISLGDTYARGSGNLYVSVPRDGGKQTAVLDFDGSVDSTINAYTSDNGQLSFGRTKVSGQGKLRMNMQGEELSGLTLRSQQGFAIDSEVRDITVPGTGLHPELKLAGSLSGSLRELRASPEGMRMEGRARTELLGTDFVHETTTLKDPKIFGDLDFSLVHTDEAGTDFTGTAVNVAHLQTDELVLAPSSKLSLRGPSTLALAKFRFSDKDPLEIEFGQGGRIEGTFSGDLAGEFGTLRTESALASLTLAEGSTLKNLEGDLSLQIDEIEGVDVSPLLEALTEGRERISLDGRLVRDPEGFAILGYELRVEALEDAGKAASAISAEELSKVDADSATTSDLLPMLTKIDISRAVNRIDDFGLEISAPLPEGKLGDGLAITDPKVRKLLNKLRVKKDTEAVLRLAVDDGKIIAKDSRLSFRWTNPPKLPENATRRERRRHARLLRKARVKHSLGFGIDGVKFKSKGTMQAIDPDTGKTVEVEKLRAKVLVRGFFNAKLGDLAGDIGSLAHALLDPKMKNEALSALLKSAEFDADGISFDGKELHIKPSQVKMAKDKSATLPELRLRFDPTKDLDLEIGGGKVSAEGELGLLKSQIGKHTLDALNISGRLDGGNGTTEISLQASGSFEGDPFGIKSSRVRFHRGKPTEIDHLSGLRIVHDRTSVQVDKIQGTLREGKLEGGIYGVDISKDNKTLGSLRSMEGTLGVGKTISFNHSIEGLRLGELGEAKSASLVAEAPSHSLGSPNRLSLSIDVDGEGQPALDSESRSGEWRVAARGKKIKLY